MNALKKYRKNTRTKAFTSINITPLTDIALTLLIIFMIATPLLIQSKLDIKLPKVETKNRDLPEQNLVIYIDDKARIFVNDKKYHFEELKILVKNVANKNSKSAVTINGDKNVKYDDIIQVLNLLKENKLENISLGVEVK